jgi:hypothetical protein
MEDTFRLKRCLEAFRSQSRVDYLKLIEIISPIRRDRISVAKVTFQLSLSELDVLSPHVDARLRTHAMSSTIPGDTIPRPFVWRIQKRRGTRWK